MLDLDATSKSVESYNRFCSNCLEIAGSSIANPQDKEHAYGLAAQQIAGLLTTLCYINLEIVRELRALQPRSRT